MNTQTHLLLSAAVFAKPNRPLRNVAALAGGLVPDMSLFIMYGWGKATSVSERVIFRDWYFDPVWQSAGAVTNSWPIYLGASLAAVSMGGKVRLLPTPMDSPDEQDRRRYLWSALLIFALAAALHVATDFPVHVNDGRPAFWPFSSWIFSSPISYWDSRYYGSIVGLFEMVLAFGLCIILWRRFSGWPARAAILVALATYAAVAHHWSEVFG